MSTPSLSRAYDLLRDLRLEIRRIEVVETEKGVHNDDDPWTTSAIEVRQQINFVDLARVIPQASRPVHPLACSHPIARSIAYHPRPAPTIT